MSPYYRINYNNVQSFVTKPMSYKFTCMRPEEEVNLINADCSLVRPKIHYELNILSQWCDTIIKNKITCRINLKPRLYIKMLQLVGVVNPI